MILLEKVWYKVSTTKFLYHNHCIDVKIKAHLLVLIVYTQRKKHTKFVELIASSFDLESEMLLIVVAISDKCGSWMQNF